MSAVAMFSSFYGSQLYCWLPQQNATSTQAVKAKVCFIFICELQSCGEIEAKGKETIERGRICFLFRPVKCVYDTKFNDITTLRELRFHAQWLNKLLRTSVD